MTILIIFYFGIIITHIFFFFLIYKNLINDQNITLTLTCPHHAMRFKPYFFFYHSPLCSNDIRILSSRIIVIFLTFFNYLFIYFILFIYLFIIIISTHTTLQHSIYFSCRFFFHTTSYASMAAIPCTTHAIAFFLFSFFLS